MKNEDVWKILSAPSEPGERKQKKTNPSFIAESHDGEEAETAQPPYSTTFFTSEVIEKTERELRTLKKKTLHRDFKLV